MASFSSRYRPGDWVRIRSKEQILRTLDASGELDNLPFMPEMLRYCGKRFPVFASAHKTCDTVNKTGGRRMRNAVHLEGLRCDGAAHGGCQAQCLLFFKEAWLEPAPDDIVRMPVQTEADDQASEATLTQHAARFLADESEPTYACQATRLFDATDSMSPASPAQYAADVSSGNVPFATALKILFLTWVFNLRHLKVGWRVSCALYDRAHRVLMGGAPPHLEGTIPSGKPTPKLELNLQVGEIVEVLPKEQIVATLNTNNQNRGMAFDKEMVRYCGQHLKVTARVTHIVNEQTGKMLKFPTASLILEGVYCTSQYSERRLLCPRRIVPYWREIWVKRVSSDSGEIGSTALSHE